MTRLASKNLFVLTMMLAFAVHAGEPYDWDRLFTRIDFTSGALTLPCQYGTVNAALPGKPALVVLLHGGSQKGSDGRKQLDSGAMTNLVRHLDDSGTKAIVVVPQCPSDRSWNERTNPVTDAVASLVTNLVDSLGADRSRVYACGYSMGGAGAWRLMGDYPYLFAAALIAAGKPLYTDAANAGLSRAWAVAGGADTIVPPDVVEPFVTQLDEAGCPVRYTLLEGADHPTVCGEAFSSERLAWVFEGREFTGYFDAATFTRGTLSLPYRVARINYLLPGPPALVTLLHGGSQKGTDNLLQLNTAAAEAVYNHLATNGIKALFVLPQCPANRSWNESTRSQPMPMTDVVSGLISNAAALARADASRFHALGYSMGGSGVWRLLNDYPKMFASGLVAAATPLMVTASRVSETPVWAVAGEQDTIMDAAAIESFSKELTARGGEARFDLLPSVGHFETCDAAFDGRRLSWVFGKSRQKGLVIILR